MKPTRAEKEIAHGRKLAADDSSHIWGWGTPAGRRRAERRAGMIAGGARLAAGIRVLEIGCGSGIFTEYFARTGINLTAIDISDDLLAIARDRLHSLTNVRFQAGRFEAFTAGSPFDAIIGSSVLHHLDLAPTLANMRTLLRPGGAICFTEPNMLNPQIMLQKNIPWLKKRMGDSPDETAFFRWILADRLREAGFVEIEITPFDWLHPATPAALLGPVESFGEMLEKLPFVREFAGSLYIRARRPI